MLLSQNFYLIHKYYKIEIESRVWGKIIRTDGTVKFLSLVSNFVFSQRFGTIHAAKK
ncbi:hypothetical protein DSM106972_041280 [Dulcicalothrix desertica PCC 7102]|uniref:Uncharacterized protein n=1 Tax=Dulcicalothrix desertica PCC 7102 TaxID=232991 RepID=A0A3S1CLV6_9CYAN|nr:hypothetical protein DSM106972_041280 [Dulcicalothrix desertica PCC 7102]